ncbi:periplasmic heavy metal sensor [Fulvivirga sp. M361]|uniref:Spy/CpxP family protein refolding chaperone n=1 Tax=Fulvivirga sp. M361 TaxID=2594266 RepID=UPI00117BA828|nr:periplasmic heavy metal sensor [Fulvivirga sp. M361]TRX57750.1 periplasmic heavy metal sensor [Fulvivirga sp. M361]
MKNSKLLMTGAILFIMISAFTTTYAQQHERGRGMRDNVSRRGALLDQIPDLTDTQKEKLNDLRVDMQKQMLPLRNQLREKEARLNTLSTTEKTNLNDLNKLVDEMGVIKIRMMKVAVAHRQKVRAELTEEQRLFFDSHAGRMTGHKRMKRSMGQRGDK